MYVSNAQVGQPTEDYSADPEGKKEGRLSKCMKRGAKLASKVTKMIVKNAGTCPSISLSLKTCDCMPGASVN